MIIDLILDRKCGELYNAKDFYNRVFEYGNAHYIDYAMDYGSEKDVCAALCKYIDENDYNPKIKDYIKSVRWLESDFEIPEWLKVKEMEVKNNLAYELNNLII